MKRNLYYLLLLSLLCSCKKLDRTHTCYCNIYKSANGAPEQRAGGWKKEMTGSRNAVEPECQKMKDDFSDTSFSVVQEIWRAECAIIEDE